MGFYMIDRPKDISKKRLRDGFEMPVFGIGTWMMGGGLAYNPDNKDSEDINAIKTAIDMGITQIDTAEKYANGHAERLVGEAIKDIDRSKLFLVSKVSRENLQYDDVVGSARGSLDRLQTSYLDLYLIHSPNLKIPIGETMQAMDALMEQGIIRNIGVSNFTIERFEKAQSKTKHRIVANQLHLNLIFREPERRGLLEYCQRNDVMFIAWRPLQKGLLAQRGIQLLDAMSEKYHKTPAQIAINWLISQPNVVTLSKMTRLAHMEENLGALGWQMEDQDIERLRREFPDQRNISDAVPLI
jgi:diketogulonate reductase-like aldo/keto reductase